MGIPSCREQTGHLDASRWDVHPPLLRYYIMKKYEILSKTQDGKLVAVVCTEARNEKEALQNTANFCYMMDIEVHSVVDASLVHGPNQS